MAARGRQPGFRMSDDHRVKIQNSNILNALIEHAEGKRDMSATQVSAATTLLRKVLPDLSSVEMSGDPENPIHHKHTVDAQFGAVVGALENLARTKSGSAGSKSELDNERKADATNP